MSCGLPTGVRSCSIIMAHLLKFRVDVLPYPPSFDELGGAAFENEQIQKGLQVVELNGDDLISATVFPLIWLGFRHWPHDTNDSRCFLMPSAVPLFCCLLLCFPSGHVYLLALYYKILLKLEDLEPVLKSMGDEMAISLRKNDALWQVRLFSSS